MLNLLMLILDLLASVMSWRLMVPFAAAVGICAMLHVFHSGGSWVSYATPPVILTGVSVGLWWETRVRP